MQKEISREQAFVQHLRRRSEPADLARLRRTVAEPGQEVIPIVEGFIARKQAHYENAWERQVYYLVAGLWASSVSSTELERMRDQPEDETQVASNTEQPEKNMSANSRLGRSLGHAIAKLYLARDRSKSIEQRFITLLDADEEQLPYRLRQMMQLLKSEDGIQIYWSELLRDLLAWNYEGKPVQQKWARAFYRTISKEGGEE